MSLASASLHLSSLRKSDLMWCGMCVERVVEAAGRKEAAEARLALDGRWPPGRDPFEVPRKDWVY